MEFKRLVKLDLSDCKGLFLFGPRQTGKSYWLSKKFPKSIYYDLLLSDLYFKLFRSPHLLREELMAKKPIKHPVVIDEIQKLPKLLDEVQYLMERHKIKFILTGSSARKIKKGSANLLGGRALYQQLFPLVSPEIPKFDLYKIMRFGSLPSIYQSKRAKVLLQSYASVYLKEEIQAEALVRNLQAFSLFLEVVAKTNAELINYSNIAHDVGLSSNTIREYYHLLEDTFLGYLLTPYKKTIKRRSVSMNKFYFFDIGVKNVLTGQWDMIEGTAEFGRRFEHFIFNEILAYLKYTQDERKICFWRSKNHQEVDFVIGDNLAVEVKSGKEIRPRDLKGLKALSEEIPLKYKILVSLSEKTSRLIEKQFLMLPYKIFLKKLWSKQFV
ncbi:MAG: AAA family ATPase [Bdellovibrionaceae bacterium]|nr:AAA family ATPase [Pseudobdellovibrionaceae bacterium]